MVAPKRTFAPALLAGVLVVVGACGRPTNVEVVVSLGPGQPLAGVEVVAWPYDPQRLLDSLAALATSPRPEFPELEAELRAFRRPEFAADDAEVRARAAVRDSVRRLSDSLGRLERSAPGYAAAYDRFRHLYERLQQRTAARDAGVRDVTAELRELAVRAGRAADSLRAWEQGAYGEFAAAASASATRVPISGVADRDGRLTLTLAPGSWWIEAQQPHRDNPFLEYRWLSQVVVQGLSFRFPLGGATARTGWRH